jgi:hypothetical protein
MESANTRSADSDDGTCGDDEMTEPKKTSAEVLHFVAATDQRRQVISYVCELQPTATIRIFGTPVRCPFCQQENPVSMDFSMRRNKEKA